MVNSVVVVVVVVYAAVSLASRCGFPGEPRRGRVSPDRPEYDVGDTVTYTCQAGYVLVGPHQIRCHRDQTWSSDAPVCLREAAEFRNTTLADDNVNTCLDVTHNKPLVIPTTPYSMHPISSVVFSLAKVSGSSSIQVSISNDKHNPQLCSDITKSDIQGQEDSNFYFKQDCRTVVTGNTLHVTVKSANAFSPVASATVCEIGITSVNETLECGRPPVPANGLVRSATDSQVTYACNKGHYIENSASIQCEGGLWRNHVQCKPFSLRCGLPATPANGFVDRVEPATGVVAYACNPGFSLVDATQRKCLPRGAWETPLTTKCVSNVAYGGMITQSDGSSGARKPSADGKRETCDTIGNDRRQVQQALWWKMDFGTSQNVTHIRVVSPRGEQRPLTVTIESGARTSPRSSISCIQTADSQTLLCQVKTSTVQAVIIQPSDVHTTNFRLCEVEINNNLEQVPCGLADEPPNSTVEYLANSTAFRFRCSAGFKPSRLGDVRCVGGRWEASPECVPSADERVRPGEMFTMSPIDTTGPSHTFDLKPDKASMLVGIMGIAIGVTAASVSIIIAIIVVVCIMKRHYRKKHSCSHDCSPGCSRQTSHSTAYRSGGSHRDWDESSIHLYETVKPEYETLDPCDDSLVVNESYVITSANSLLNRSMRPKLAPPRNHIYDTVAVEDHLDKVQSPENGHTQSLQRDTIYGHHFPRTSL